MPLNHVDTVQRIRDAEPPGTWASTEAMLGFVLRVLAALPASERAGLVKAPPGGENVSFFSGQPVRVNRVAYPDGTLIKILTDSGPGGTNGAAWNLDDTRPDLYFPIDPGTGAAAGASASTAATSPPPTDLGPVLTKIAELAARLERIESGHQAIGATLASLSEAVQQSRDDLASLIAAKTMTVQFPAYTGQLGYNLRLTPERS
jgi:hypothetical protein